MSKSHVGMGFYLCPVCGCKHNEVILLDKRLKESLEKDNFMGMELCAEHQELYNKGYVALVGIDEEESPKPIEFDTAYRTGAICHVTPELFTDMMNVPIPDNPARLALCSSGVINHLQTLQEKANDT